MKQLSFLLCTALMLWTGVSCKKSVSENSASQVAGSNRFRYSDSIFYLMDDAYVVTPLVSKAGVYTAFPDNLNIDSHTGAITVSLKGKDHDQSQTGMRYKIYFTSATGETDSTTIVLAGITYQDRIYHLSQNESVIYPIYNADPDQSLPGGAYTCSDNKVALNAANGQIDIKQTLKNGLFNRDPESNDWRLVTVTYTTNDKSTSKKNSLDVVLYYYPSMAHVPANVSTVMRAHQELLLRIEPADIPVTHAAVDESVKNIVSLSKPRPPCIIIVGD